MGYRLTKFQLGVWDKLQPFLKDTNCKFDLTFDDEYVIYRDSEYGSHNIIVPPKNEIIYSCKDNKGKSEVIIYSFEHVNVDEIVQKFLR